MNKIFSTAIIAASIGITASLITTSAIADDKVQADKVYWQTNASGCVPSTDTVNRKKSYSVSGIGRVKYTSNGTKPLVFSCPVNNINDDDSDGKTVMRLFYQDSDGKGDDVKVEAILKSVAKSNGEVNQACKATSDKKGAWSESTGVCSKIDMDANIYWVEVSITHLKADNAVVEFSGVSLETSGK